MYRAKYGQQKRNNVKNTTEARLLSVSTVFEGSVVVSGGK